MQQDFDPTKTKPKALYILGLAVFIVAAFFPALSGSWLGDDLLVVINAPCAFGVSTWPDILQQQAGQCNYRPIRYLSYALDYSIWGLNPLGYHLSNLLIHLAAVLFAYLLLQQFGLKRFWSLFGALVFAIHPVQADAVAYISGRRDVLMGLWFLISIWSLTHLSSLNSQTSQKKFGWTLLALIAAILSVLSKEMGITIAAIAILYILFGSTQGFESSQPLKARAILNRIWQYKWLFMPLSALAIAVFIYRGLLHPMSAVADTLFGGTLDRHIGTVFSLHARYIELIFFPLRLAGDYRAPVVPIADGLFDIASVVGFLWLVGLTSLSFYWLTKGRRREAFGLFWYLITMLPVSHIIPHHEPAAEHYLYIPLIGLILTAGSLCQNYFDGFESFNTKKRLYFRVSVILALLVMLLWTRTLIRSFDYQSEIQHSAATLKWFPESIRGQARHGLALLAEEHFEQARPHLETVLVSQPVDSTPRLDVLRILGGYYAQNGKPLLAIKVLKEYLQFYPNNPSALQSLAKAYFELDQLDRAEENVDKLLKLKPDSIDYKYLKALILGQRSDYQTATVLVEQILRIEPTHFDTLILGASLSLMTERDDAHVFLSRAEEAFEDLPAEKKELSKKTLQSLRAKLNSGGDESQKR